MNLEVSVNVNLSQSTLDILNRLVDTAAQLKKPEELHVNIHPSAPEAEEEELEPSIDCAPEVEEDEVETKSEILISDLKQPAPKKRQAAKKPKEPEVSTDLDFAEEFEEPKKEAVEVVTHEMVMKAAKAYVKAHGVNAARGILSKFKAKNILALNADECAEAFKLYSKK